MNRHYLIIAALTAFSIPAHAQETNGTAQAMLESVIDCNHEFAPEEVIVSLQKAGVIGRKPASTFDGIPTYFVKKPITIHGLKVKLIEGWEYGGEMFSFPGRNISPPPTHITVGFNENDVDNVKKMFPDSKTNKFKGEQFSSGLVYFTDANYSRKVGKSDKSYPSVTCSLSL